VLPLLQVRYSSWHGYLAEEKVQITKSQPAHSKRRTMSASPSATPTHDPSVASIEELLDSVYESHVPDDWEDEDEDDDDIDFEPAVEDIEEDSDADGENEYEGLRGLWADSEEMMLMRLLDASEDLSGIDIEFALEGDEEEEEEEEGNTENETGAARPVYGMSYGKLE